MGAAAVLPGLAAPRTTRHQGGGGGWAQGGFGANEAHGGEFGANKAHGGGGGSLALTRRTGGGGGVWR